MKTSQQPNQGWYEKAVGPYDNRIQTRCLRVVFQGMSPVIASARSVIVETTHVTGEATPA